MEIATFAGEQINLARSLNGMNITSDKQLLVKKSIGDLLGYGNEENELSLIIAEQLHGGMTENNGFSQKGHFSKCRIVGEHIVKSFTDNRLDPQELDALYDGFLGYREGLVSLGMNIPRSVFSTKNNETKSLLFVDEKISDGVHVDFEDKLVRLRDLDIMAGHFDAAIETLLTFGAHEKNNIKEKNGFLRFGADFKPANITFDTNNNLYLLDLFAPKVRGLDGEILYIETIHALSREVLEYIHFHKIGVLYWFYFKAKSVLESHDTNPVLLAIIRKKIEIAILQITGSESHRYINSLDIPYRELPEDILKGSI